MQRQAPPPPSSRRTSVPASENVEASLELSRMAMLRIGVEAVRSEQVLSAFRRRYHAQIHEPEDQGEGARPDRFRDIE